VSRLVLITTDQSEAELKKELDTILGKRIIGYKYNSNTVWFKTTLTLTIQFSDRTEFEFKVG
jgi:hypothetical protein